VQNLRSASRGGKKIKSKSKSKSKSENKAADLIEEPYAFPPCRSWLASEGVRKTSAMFTDAFASKPGSYRVYVARKKRFAQNG
jgi:hypothetical protein